MYVATYVATYKYMNTCKCSFSPATDITPRLLITPTVGKQKYPLPLSFNDTLSIVSTLVTTSPSRVLFIILDDDTATGGLSSVNQPVESAALLVLLSKITQLNTALLPSQTLVFVGC